MFKPSKKLLNLPPYLFLEIDKAKRQARAQGRDIIDLGIGDPDQPTPKFIIDTLYNAALDPANHRYALDQGVADLRQAIAQWYKRRFTVTLDAASEVLPLIGSKEGIAHFPLAFINPGDYSLVPDPCYPPYKGGTIFAGGKPYSMPLLETNSFFPDLKKIPLSVIKKCKIIYINYPNNPTSAICDEIFYKKVLDFAHKHRLIVISDLAYSEIYFDNLKPMSFLELDGAKEVCIEFHSLSKTFNMTGWRIGWACGNKNLVAALGKVKANIDSGIFSAIQMAGAMALNSGDRYTQEIRDMYQLRRDVLVDGLNSLGWKVNPPKATFYVWVKTLKDADSINFSQKLLREADIVVTPGVGFGKSGEDYIRMALTVEKERLSEAVERLRKIF